MTENGLSLVDVCAAPEFARMDRGKPVYSRCYCGARIITAREVITRPNCNKIEFHEHNSGVSNSRKINRIKLLN